MLKNKLRIAMFFVVAIFLVSLTNITALANELPDLNITGTITITMEKDGKAIPGGEFELYHIANLVESDGSFKYAFTKNFKNCGLSLSNIETDKFASDLERYIKSNKTGGIVKKVDRNGIAKFTQLDAGIYFVIQNEAAEGYDKANSFTLSLPVLEDGKYNYNVNANPKFSLSGSKSNTKTTTVKTSKPTEPKLPQTGQLNLPVPILAASGICMFVLGLIIRFSGRKEKNEK